LGLFKALRIQDDGQRVAAEDSIGEDIDGHVATLHDSSKLWGLNPLPALILSQLLTVVAL
jgi:hypothetical protein